MIKHKLQKYLQNKSKNQFQLMCEDESIMTTEEFYFQKCKAMNN